MSEVNASDTRPIESINDVIDTYQGVGQDSMAGVEVELAFFNPASPDLTPMTIPQNKVVKNALNNQLGEEAARNEPTSEMLEIGSVPAGVNDLQTVMNDTQHKIEALTQKAEDIGLKRSYFQALPEKSASQLLQNVMDVERYQAFFGPPRKDMEDVAAYFSVCKSNQVSISYRDPDHALTNVRRLYALAPFLFMIMDNAAPFNEGQCFKGHAGMHHRAALKDRGGVPPYIFTAQSGDEFIENHIDHVMNNPLFVHYDEKGKLIRLPSGTWTSFNKLREQGLNTATNYFFAESILWPDVKIAALKDSEGQVVNHRYEARMLGVGLHQHQTSLLVVAALAFDEDFALSVDALLKKYSFDLSGSKTLKSPVERAYSASLNHKRQFLDIPYGSGTMAEFAKDFAELIEKSMLLKPYSEQLLPLLMICKTGMTDSKVNALLFDTLEKALHFQRHYESEIFSNPNQCALMLFKDDINSPQENAGENACF